MKKESLKVREITLPNTYTTFPKNIVRNQKYTALTFPFIVFINQFRHFFNIYFFFICVSQCFPSYSVSPLISNIGPWALVLFLTLLKEGMDDYKRYKRDKEANSQQYNILDVNNNNTNTSESMIKSNKNSKSKNNNSTNNNFNLPVKKVPSSSLKVGDIILLEKNQRIPADCLLLKTSDPNGTCFIRTDQLDGETDWKLRISPHLTQNINLKSIFNGKNNIRVSNNSINLDNNRTDNDNVNNKNNNNNNNIVINTNINNTANINKYTSVSIYADKPHKDIYSFIGKLSVKDTNTTKTCSLNLENMLWMNTVLATGNALCCIIYTGTDTKAQLNTSKPKNKYGLIESELSTYTIFLCILSVIIACIFTFLRGVTTRSDATLIRFIVILSNVIPISLKVSIDWARYVYSRVIMTDSSIKGCIVRTSNIPEELGRIEYILSDKTGTLTRNEMEMKKVHLGTVCYTEENEEDIKNVIRRITGNSIISDKSKESDIKSEEKEKSSKNANINTDNKNIYVNLKKKDLTSRVFELIRALSICHNVTPSDGNYQASSPDEVAIVQFTEKVGLKLLKRTRDFMEIQDVNNNIHKIKILQIFPFTSETKRMGIIVEYQGMECNINNSDIKGVSDEDNNVKGVNDKYANEGVNTVNSDPQIIMYLKGADTVMRNRVKYNDWLDEEVDNMAREGLRTLVIAMKYMKKEEYNTFMSKYEAASISITDRNKEMSDVLDQYQVNMTLLGLTGVEDKLQENVRLSIESLRNASIKIWMLTGDKIETACSIAISSRLFRRQDVYYVIEGVKNREEGYEVMCRLTGSKVIYNNSSNLKGVNNSSNINGSDNGNSVNNTPFDAVVIDGSSLQVMLDHFPLEFIGVACKLSAVVCCRVSPTQKGVIAKVLRSMGKGRVCCIGDGGNDVSMITESDVGVGIVGKEGNQASLAADFSILRFCDVVPLILWHGRNCLLGTGRLSHFIIHRGTIISVMQAIFCSLFLFSPINLYQGIILVGYVTLYTFFPVFCMIISYDVSRRVVLQYPELYYDLLNNKVLSIKNFAVWNVVSFYQGSIIMLLSFYFFEHELFSIVSITFSCLIVNEILMVGLTVRMNKYMFYSMAISLFFYILSFFVLRDELRMPCGVFRFVCCVIVINLCAVIFSLVQKAWSRYVAPPTYRKLEVE